MRKDVSVLQNPAKMTVYHELHCLSEATNEAGQSVPTCQEEVFAWFRNRDYRIFSLGIWY
jgi:hypothetical protein